MITIINSTCELGGGEYRMYQLDDEADASKTADGRKAFLFKSRIIKAIYLFVEVKR